MVNPDQLHLSYLKKSFMRDEIQCIVKYISLSTYSHDYFQEIFRYRTDGYSVVPIKCVGGNKCVVRRFCQILINM